MIEVFRTGDLDRGICAFKKEGFEIQAKKWEAKTGLSITKYYTQVITDGIIIASYIPKKEE